MSGFVFNFSLRVINHHLINYLTIIRGGFSWRPPPSPEFFLQNARVQGMTEGIQVRACPPARSPRVEIMCPSLRREFKRLSHSVPHAMQNMCRKVQALKFQFNRTNGVSIPGNALKSSFLSTRQLPALKIYFSPTLERSRHSRFTPWNFT